MIRCFHDLSPASADQKVMYPGELELITQEQRLKQGIPLGLNLIEEMNQLAEQFGIPALEF